MHRLSRKSLNWMMMRRQMFLEDLGCKGVRSGKTDSRQATACLGLISYLTAGEDETRAWTIKKGTKAPQAAGKIHSDFERGFIRAEVVNYQDLLDCGSLFCSEGERACQAWKARIMSCRTAM